MAQIVNNPERPRTITQSISDTHLASTSLNGYSASAASTATSGVVSVKMGGLVSRLNAVFFGHKLKDKQTEVLKVKPAKEPDETGAKIGIINDKGTSVLSSDIENPSCNELDSDEAVQTYVEIDERGDDCQGGLTQETRHGDDVILLSEGEISADEEQQEVDDNENFSDDALERIDSDEEDVDEDADVEFIDDSEAEDEEDLIDDESEVDDTEDHICDSECEHSDVEYDSEPSGSDIEETDGSEIHSDDEGDVVDITDDESGDDRVSYQSDRNDSSEGCEENEHECSSDCGCQFVHSDSEEETVFTEQDPVSPLRETAPPIPTPRQNGNNSALARKQVSLTELSRRKTYLTDYTERNNNRALQPSNSVEIMGELRSAIDARVRRSASCREVSTQMKFSSCSLDDTTRSGKESVKDRRARLRTLELKREQILDEVRDGAKDRVIDAMYR